MRAELQTNINRLRGIHQLWQRTTVAKAGKGWWRRMDFEAAGFPLVTGLAAACIPLDAAMWSLDFHAMLGGVFQFSVTNFFLHYEHIFLIAMMLSALVNGIIVDRYIVYFSPQESYRPLWVKMLRLVCCCIPLVCLAVVFYWNRYAAPGKRPAQNPFRSQERIQRNWVQRISSTWVLAHASRFRLFALFTVLVLSNGFWHFFLTLWLTHPSPRWSGHEWVRPCALVAYHLGLTWAMIRYWIHLKGKLQVQARFTSWLWPPVGGLVPVPFWSLAFSVRLISLDSRSRKTWVSRTFIKEQSPARQPRWLRLETGLLQSRQSGSGFLPWRPRVFTATSGSAKERSMRVAFFRIRVWWLIPETVGLCWLIARFGPDMFLNYWPWILACLALLVPIFGSLATLAAIQCWWRGRPDQAKQIYGNRTADFYAAITLLASAGIVWVWQNQGAFQAGQWIVRASVSMFAIQIWKSMVDALTGESWEKAFGLAWLSLLTLLPLGLIVLSGEGPAQQCLTILLILAALSPILGGLSVLVPYRWYAKAAQTMPSPHQQQFLTWIRTAAFFPFGGLVIPYVMRLHHRLSNS